MKGYYAFNEKPPGRSKIRKRNILWILRGVSSSYELHSSPTSLPSLLQHLPRFLGHCIKNNVYHCINVCVIKYTIQYFFQKNIIFENSFAKSKTYFRFLDIFVIFRLCSLLLCKKYKLYTNINYNTNTNTTTTNNNNISLINT